MQHMFGLAARRYIYEPALKQVGSVRYGLPAGKSLRVVREARAILAEFQLAETSSDDVTDVY